MRQQEAKKMVNILCDDFSVPCCRSFFVGECSDVAGEYSAPNRINFFGEPSLGTVLHEVAHHIDFHQNGPRKRAHTKKFFAVCNNVREWVKSAYDFADKETSGIYGYYQNCAANDAAYEYFKKNHSN